MRPRPAARSVLFGVCVAASLIVSPAGAAPAGAAPFPDFDADGYGDLVIPAAREDFDGREDAGAVHVLRGGPGGVVVAGNRLFVESPASGNAEFARSLASGDFDGDGFDDLAVGAPGAVVGGVRGAGALTVLYGTPEGLGEQRRFRFTQATNHVPGSPEPWDAFALALAVGDFDGDGDHDLAVGAPGEDSAGRSDVGVVHVFLGSRAGLRATGSRVLSQDTAGVPGLGEAGDEFGRSLAAADVDRDGYDDLAVGAPHEDIGTLTDAGALWLIAGSAAGPAAGEATVITQNTPKVAGLPEAGDRFAWALAAGDVHGDGFADVAAGIPGEDIGSVADSGGGELLAGSAAGLSGHRSQFWAQAVAGVPGADERQDYFGFSLDIGYGDGDSRADLVVGAVGEGFGGLTFAGAVTVLRGTARGLDASGALQWTQNSSGVPGVAEDTELFGALVRFTDLDGDGTGELVVGVPGESIDGRSFAGALHVIPASLAGPSATGASLWHQGVAGVTGNVEDDDWFGGTLEL